MLRINKDRQKKVPLLFIPVVLFLASCTSSISSIYDFEYPLTQNAEQAVSSSFNLLIPQGWFAAEDNECNCNDLWLVKKDYTATIKFKAVNVDSLTGNRIKEKPDKLLEYSRLFVKIKLGKDFKQFENEEGFEKSGIPFYAYEYKDKDNLSIRTVVFTINNRAYESVALPAGKGVSAEEVFRAQNAVLASIK